MEGNCQATARPMFTKSGLRLYNGKEVGARWHKSRAQFLSIPAEMESFDTGVAKMTESINGALLSLEGLSVGDAFGEPFFSAPLLGVTDRTIQESSKERCFP